MSMSRPKSPAKGGVGIGALVMFDFVFGGLGFVGSLFLISLLSQVPPQAYTFLLVTSVVSLLMSLGLIVMGVLLFTRKLWAYQVALFGHGALFLFQILNVVLTIQQNNNGGGGTPGIPIFGLILVGLCAHHAWKLVQQEKELQEIRNARGPRASKLDDANDPELEAKPGWDEGRRKH